MVPEVQTHVSLAQHTTLHAGGVARYFVEVTTTSELSAALAFAAQKSLPIFVLGGGSNVLFADTGFDGLVIKNAIRGLKWTPYAQEVMASVGAGENWDAFVAAAVAQGYWGVENLSSIPGTVGATPIQNVGAYGVEVAEVIESVTALHQTSGEEKTFPVAECAFGYRDSYFKTPAGRAWIITQVTFRLSQLPQPNLNYADLRLLQEASSAVSVAEVRAAVVAIRAQKFPDWSTVGTAGSFFKNPVVSADVYEKLRATYPDLPAHQTSTGDWKLSLGWLLDKVCNLKGYCRDGVCLYERQALVLINTGSSAKNIIAFKNFVTQQVYEKTEIKIEPEVLLLESSP